MKRNTLVCTLATALVLALVLGGCSTGFSKSEQQDAATSHEAATKLAEGHAKAAQQNYNQAIDAFVDAAGDSRASSDAVKASADTLTRQLAGDRLPTRLDAALMLQKRLPAGTRSDGLRATVESFLVTPVIDQVHQAEVLLKDRQAFVRSMRDQDQGDALPTPADQRSVTESEVVDAQSHLQDLRMPAEIVKLYEYERPLAAAMDRFLADDQRYLNQQDVSSQQLDEIDQSCHALAEALWPVQRQLDRVRPGWR
jgi:hypothetical protein